MIDQVESAIERFAADGAYDTKAIYAALHETGYIPQKRERM
ncbi:MAG: transposase [Myxococcota bacterium]|jgi:transposase